MHRKKHGPRMAGRGRVCVQPRGCPDTAKSSTRHRFNREHLPNAATYYHRELGTPVNATGWRSVRCPFHDDTHASFSINADSGGFVCHACGVKGGDVLAFHRQRYGLDFVSAAKELGAWR